MSPEGQRELVAVLVMMGVLFLFGVIAVIIFFRVWWKEQKERKKGRDA